MAASRAYDSKANNSVPILNPRTNAAADYSAGVTVKTCVEHCECDGNGRLSCKSFVLCSEPEMLSICLERTKGGCECTNIEHIAAVKV